MPVAENAALLAQVLDHRLIQPVFQPVIDLDSGAVAGYEALARGPAGPLHQPQALFAAARDAGRLTELDWLCRETAVAAARDAGLRFPLSLFVNAEPETLLAGSADTSRWAEFADLRCYAELTERALTAQPGRLFAAVDQIRAQDWGVALDDLGAESASLALLPLLQPDVIKLDLRVVQQPPAAPGDAEIARIVHAALAHATAAGAVVVVEGIETDQQRQLARGYGAHYGQGFLLGRPGPLPQPLAAPPAAVPLVRRQIDRAGVPAPFALVAGPTPTRRLPRETVFELARQLLAQAATLTPPPVVLVAADTLLPDPLPALLGQLSTAVPLTAILGGPQPGLTTTPLSPTDPARSDIDITIVAPHFAAALVARPALDDSSQLDTVLTLDRHLATAAATALLLRV